MRGTTRAIRMRSLENGVWANLKCHFGGLAIQIQQPETKATAKFGSRTNPKDSRYDVEATAEATYRAVAELASKRYGNGAAEQPDAQQLAEVSSKTDDAVSKARQKVVAALKESPEISEVGDLFHEDPFKGFEPSGAFAPIFFVYNLPRGPQAQHKPEKEALVSKLHFVYNGKFLTAAAFCGPDREISGISEAVSKVCLQMSRSGLGFHWLSPIPTYHSLDIGNVSLASSPTSAVLNDSVQGGGTSTTLLVSAPKRVPNVLRSVYTGSFQYLMSFYSLKEQSNTGEALMQTIQAHRETVLDLLKEFNQSKRRQFLRRRRLRGLIRAHCLSLTEKIGRLDALSDSLAQGIDSLDGNLQQEPRLRAMLEAEPGWKSYLRHDFETKPTLDMITRTSEELRGHSTWPVTLLIAVLAAILGGFLGFFISRIV